MKKILMIVIILNLIAIPLMACNTKTNENIGNKEKVTSTINGNIENKKNVTPTKNDNIENKEHTTSTNQLKDKSQIKQDKTLAPIVAEGIILGGLDKEGHWIDEERMTKVMNGDEEFRIYSDNKYVKNVFGTGKRMSEASGNIVCDVDVKDSRNYFAIKTDKEIVLRETKTIANDNSRYLKIAKDFLAEKEIIGEPVIKNIKKVDLEGDNVDEVIIVMQNYKDLMFFDKLKEDKYSFVILRKIIDGKVKTIVLKENIAKKNEEDLLINNDVFFIGDVDNDNIMEIVLENGYYEGYGFSIQDVNNDIVKEIAINGDGA